MQYSVDVIADANRLFVDLWRADSVPQADGGVGYFRILHGEAPEWIFDDGRGVAADPKFQKKHRLFFVVAQEVLITLGCLVPATVFNEGVITAQVHGHWRTANWAAWDQFGRNAHILLAGDHFTHGGLVVISFLVTRHAALPKSKVALSVEQALFVKTCFLEAVVNVSGDHKVIFFSYKIIEHLVGVVGNVHITVNKNVTTPKRPLFF